MLRVLCLMLDYFIKISENFQCYHNVAGADGDCGDCTES